MEVQRAKILLEKINALYRSIDADQGKIAAIERDLMLNYIRQLYEVFLDAGDGATSAAPEEAPFDVVDPRTRERRPQPEPLKRTYKPPRIIEIPEPEPQQRQPPPPPQPTPPAPAPKAEAPRREPEPAPVHPQPTGTPADLDLLFENRRATELSEKLSESPVSDLTKAMAINDRLLYMNDLFGRSMNDLDETLRQLNRLGSMTEAKNLLLDIARRHNWTDEEKIDTARSFVKMVRRRYL